MRPIAILTACAFLIVVSGAAQAGPFSPVATPVGPSAIELVATKKSETVTQKVERAWKGLVGYKFNVACPFGGSRTCSETGKSRAAAHGTCIAKNAGCWVTDAN